MDRPPRISRQARLVLECLLVNANEWRHGYDLSKQTGLKSGTLYPLLIRLQDGGDLEARWSEPAQPGRPPRHEYRLTGKGRERARALARQTAVSKTLPIEGGAIA